MLLEVCLVSLQHASDRRHKPRSEFQKIKYIASQGRLGPWSKMHNTSKRIQEDRTKAEVKAIEPWQQLFGAVVGVNQDLAQLAPLVAVSFVGLQPPTHICQRCRRHHH